MIGAQSAVRFIGGRPRGVRRRRRLVRGAVRGRRNRYAQGRTVSRFVAASAGVKITEVERRDGLGAGLRCNERLLEDFLTPVSGGIGRVERRLRLVSFPLRVAAEHGALD